tara:strand:+ start:156 stop:938 length:783 start_codon:yes stop_codon:yes gene_type:complete
MDFEEKTVLITGAGSGIGKSAANRFANGGANLVLADINEQSLDKTCDEIRDSGRNVISVKLDVGNLDEIDQMVEKAVSAFNGIDVLFNNAGLTRHISFLDIEEEHWDQIHRVNSKGAFFCMQKIARSMVARGQGGRIVNTASIAGRGYRRTSNAAYAASKGAVIAMTYIASSVLAPHDINVNAVCPGIVQTNMLSGILSGRSDDSGSTSNELRDAMVEEIPIGRANEADDVSALAVFLAGPGSRNITGQAFNVDGGMIMS